MLIALAGCAATETRDLQPAAQTNDVALTNLQLGVEYIRRGEYEKALEKLERAKEADPRYPLIYNTYGVLYERLGDYNGAEQNFKKSLQLDRNNSAALNNYGRFLCRRHREKEADETFLRAANNPLYETPEIPLTNAGTCALSNGRMDDAEKYFRRALSLNPRVPTALFQMAKISMEQDRALNARGYLQRYLEVAKHTAETLWLGIRIERELGDKNAVSSYALLLRNEFPDSEEARLLRESTNR